MERKIQRESVKYMEKQFKKYDLKGSGAIPVSAMEEIVTGIVPAFDEEELKEMLEAHLAESTYVVLNKETRQFDLKSEMNTIDFPSAMAILVHFLKKQERRNTNEFAGKGLIRLQDMPKFSILQEQLNFKANRKMF